MDKIISLKINLHFYFSIFKTSQVTVNILLKKVTWLFFCLYIYILDLTFSMKFFLIKMDYIHYSFDYKMQLNLNIRN